MVRSRFLVHWTGKDLKRDRLSLNDEDRARYVTRLASILDDGFWMAKPIEKVLGKQNSFLQYEIPMTCFTEVRLSQAFNHAANYGLLGVGVDRSFVLDRHGGPVLYVRNNQNESLVHASAQVWGWVQHAKDEAVKWSFYFTTSFLKAMSNATDDFSLLEEHEWRIVEHPEQVAQGRMLKIDGSKQAPFLKIPIPANELRLVVFPDAHTRDRAWQEAPVREKLSKAILVTLDECGHF